MTGSGRCTSRGLPVLEALEPRLLLSGDVLISEFMADNSSTLVDGDGNYSDWIELQNTSINDVVMTGWVLKDGSNEWVLPEVTLPGKGYLVVFASDEDKQDSLGYWHTNFKLSKADGEYLALLDDTGEVVHEYLPRYPEQLGDISYGVLTTEERLDVLMNKGCAATYVIPTEEPDSTWIDPAFDDSGWNTGTTGLGFGVTGPGENIELIGDGSSWRFLDDGSDQGSSWRQSSFDDGEWAFGPAELGYGDGDENTVVSYGDRSRDKYITTYFRHEFDVDNAWAFTDLMINVLRDDGAVIYLNGQEIARSNMPTGEIDYRSRAGVAGGINESTFYEYHRDPTGILVEGNNVLAVEIHQTSPTSADISFDLELIGTVSLYSPIETNLQTDMLGVSPSALVRIPFTVIDPLEYTELTLEVAYDDGFVAYLNGQQVAVRNAPTPPVWNSTALSNRSAEDALQFEAIDLTDYLDLDVLVAGENVLAIHALNDGVSDPTFLICPKLIALAGVTVEENYFTTTTPGAANIASVLGMVADTKFSVDRGFYDEAFDVAITTKTFDAQIRYTLDGSAPTATTGTVYVTPIHIGGTSFLRAAAYKPGYLSTNVDTQTYIFLDDVLAQSAAPTGFPDLWNGTVANYAVDQNVVNHPDYSDTIRDDLQSIPTVSLVTSVEDMFGSSGIYANPSSEGVAWERPVSVEWINSDGTTLFQVNAGVQIAGGSSRGVDIKKHSLRLVFKGMYGPKTLNYAIFGDDAADSFNTITLRAGFSDRLTNGTLLQDRWAAERQLSAGGVASHGSFVHLYIDGLYWGLYNPVERPDDAFAANYLGGEKEDYDAYNIDGLNAGNATAWNQLLGLLENPVANYSQIEQVLDIPDFCDYLIVNQYGGNWDWPQSNWWASYNRENEGKWRFHSWDAEGCLTTLTSNRVDRYSSPLGDMYWQLLQVDEFKQVFADRAHRLLFNDGALTPEANIAWLDSAAGGIYEAIVGETARWGDGYGDNELLRLRDQYWTPRINWLRESYFPQRTAIYLDQLGTAGLLPEVDAPSFEINGSPRHGGTIASGDLLTMENPSGSGTLYYTLDGTDPRLPGGAVNTDSAVAYGAAVALDFSAVVSARVLDGGLWSALNEATYDVSTDPTIAITEINYNPYDPTASEEGAGYVDAEEFEFVELRNTGSQSVNLRTVHFSDGIEFDFTRSDVTFLDPDEYVVVVRNTAAFQARYASVDPNIIAGEFTGFLNSGGEDLQLSHGASSVILDFSYNDAGEWPGRADGKGATLTIIDTAGDCDDPDNWQSSTAYGGTPGAEPQSPLGIVINEVLTHTDDPLVDSIELYNTTASPVDISGWFLSDTWGSFLNPLNGDYKKFKILPDTWIPAGGYVVFDENDFNSPGGGSLIAFALDGAHGEDVWVMKADNSGDITHFADHVAFGGARNGESFGRWPDGDGGLYPMTALTLGGDNSGPREFDSLIISELYYNSSEPGAVDDLEFVEIHNPTDQDVNLTDWRIYGGVDYDFDAGTIIAPGGTLVVLSFNPDNPDNGARLTAFRNTHGIDGSVDLVGGYSGDLDNTGGRVALQSPDEPPAEEPDYIPHLIEDEVNYDNEAPWPTSGDGGGHSLSRSDPDHFGNDSTSWKAAVPTPGFYVANRAPSFTSTPVTVASENASFTYVVTTGDPDQGDLLQITATTLPGWLTLADNGDGTATLEGIPLSGDAGENQVSLRVADEFGGLSVQDFPITVYAYTAPVVVQVLVRGSAWSEVFLDGLDSEGLGHPTLPRLGYRIPDGAEQLDILPWGNLDTIVICFNRNVVVRRGYLALSGVNVDPYTIISFDYNSSTFTASWTVDTAIVADKLLIDLSDSVQDVAYGDALDGDWTNGTGSFPSGNAAAGGNFQFRLNVVPGDTSRSDTTDHLDGYGIRDRMFFWAGDAGYGQFHDLNGSGRIDFLDWSIVRANLNATLPIDEPAVALAIGSVQGAAPAAATVGMPLATALVAPPVLESEADLLAESAMPGQEAAIVAGDVPVAGGVLVEVDTIDLPAPTGRPAPAPAAEPVTPDALMGEDVSALGDDPAESLDMDALLADILAESSLTVPL